MRAITLLILFCFIWIPFCAYSGDNGADSFSKDNSLSDILSSIDDAACKNRTIPIFSLYKRLTSELAKKKGQLHFDPEEADRVFSKDFFDYQEFYSKQKSIFYGIIVKLIQNGASVNSPDHLDRSPMMQAIVIGDIFLVKYLFSNGANVNWVNKHGENAIIYSIRFGDNEITRWLIEHGAALDTQCFSSITEIVESSLYELSVYVDLFLLFGAKANSASIDKAQNKWIPEINRRIQGCNKSSNVLSIESLNSQAVAYMELDESDLASTVSALTTDLAKRGYVVNFEYANISDKAKTKKVSLKIERMKLLEAMKLIFGKFQLEFRLNKDTIYLYGKNVKQGRGDVSAEQPRGPR